MTVTSVDKQGEPNKLVLICEGMESSAILSGLVTLLSQGNRHSATLIMMAIGLASQDSQHMDSLKRTLEAALPCKKHAPKEEQELMAPIPGMIVNMLKAGRLVGMVIKH